MRRNFGLRQRDYEVDAPGVVIALALCAILAVLLFIAVALYGLLTATPVRAQDFHSNPWLLSWIPATCCVTADCCWEIQERELTPLPDDNWQVRSTGQIRKRTAFSPDGKFYRCACDHDAASMKWIRHQGANTRCIFVPMRSAER